MGRGCGQPGKDEGVAPDYDALTKVREALAHRSFRVRYQPIVDLFDGKVVAVEALSRFTSTPYRPPDAWFADAWRVGMGSDLEVATLEEALAGLEALPESCGLAVNLSPAVITHPGLARRLDTIDAARLVVELTEHVAVDDYESVSRAMRLLRDRGIRLAVDDTGAGYASFRHIVRLRPDIIKIDHELVHGIGEDPVRLSLAGALKTFADNIGAYLVAEGIESSCDLDVVGSLGIRYGQGLLLGAPQAATSVPLAVPLGRAAGEDTGTASEKRASEAGGAATEP